MKNEANGLKGEINTSFKKQDDIAKSKTKVIFKKIMGKLKYDAKSQNIGSIGEKSTNVFVTGDLKVEGNLNQNDKKKLLDMLNKYDESFLDDKIAIKNNNDNTINIMNINDAINLKITEIINSNEYRNKNTSINKVAYSLLKKISKKDLYYILITFIVYKCVFWFSKKQYPKYIIEMEKEKAEELNNYFEKEFSNGRYLNYSDNEAFQFLEPMGVFRYMPNKDTSKFFFIEEKYLKIFIKTFPWYKTEIFKNSMIFKNEIMISHIFNIWAKSKEIS